VADKLQFNLQFCLFSVIRLLFSLSPPVRRFCCCLQVKEVDTQIKSDKTVKITAVVPELRVRVLPPGPHRGGFPVFVVAALSGRLSVSRPCVDPVSPSIKTVKRCIL
jgi:hypothetical protein